MNTAVCTGPPYDGAMRRRMVKHCPGGLANGTANVFMDGIRSYHRRLHRRMKDPERREDRTDSRAAIEAM